MIATTAPDAAADTDQDAADGATYWVCWDCGGPCLTFKGSVHGWRCQSCIARYLDDGAARWLARARKEQEKLRAKLATATALPAMNDDNPTVSAANGKRRRNGGALGYVPASVPASINAAGGSGGQRYVPRRADDHELQEGLT